MNMAAYYNECDPKAAAWLRELIKQGHIADGVVDDRSIEDVTPNELLGFTQCHFFAGIGVWSYALRRAGWADDRPVWTGSCPCQPFSAAGKGAGFADERHLWPAFHHLISQCRPDVVLGEQVASKDGLDWLDLVQADLEATGYASGAVDLCAAGVGAPHIRQRLWWVGARLADTAMCGRKSVTDEQAARVRGTLLQQGKFGQQFGDLGATLGDMADTSITGLQGREWRGPTGTQGSPSGHSAKCGCADGVANAADAGFQIGRRGSSEQPRSFEQPERLCSDGRLANTDSNGRGAWDRIRSDGQEHDVEYGGGEVGLANSTSIGWVEGVTHDGWLRCGDSAEGKVGRSAVNGDMGNGLADTSGIGRRTGGVWHNGGNDGNQSDANVKDDRPSPTNGFWRDADWLFCRDGKWRPVEPGTSPLAHGSAARVGRLRGYGNAIVAQAAQAFIESVM
jgi:DNA (cytosine-5)-methyltransferase 1